jgi:hypothetical protein
LSAASNSSSPPVGFIEGFDSRRGLPRSFRSGLPDRSSVLCRLLTPAASSLPLLGSTLSVAGAHVPQASPDKNVNCNCTTAAFTVEAQPRTSVCWATSSASSANYAICHSASLHCRTCVRPLPSAVCSSAHSVELHLPSHDPSRDRS